MPEIVTCHRLSVHGVYIEGRWYWNEALYGRRGRVCVGGHGDDAVNIYSTAGDFICTARIV